MFSFFRDALLQVRGIDVEAAHEQDLQKAAEKAAGRKDRRVLVPVYVKRILYVMGGLFLAMAVCIMAVAGAGVPWVVLSVLDVAAIVAFALRKRETEIAGLILTAAFVVILALAV